MPPKKGTKGKPKGRPASPIAGPSSAKKSRKVDKAASFLDSDSDEFADDARSVAMSDVRSGPIERPVAVECDIIIHDEDAPLARRSKLSKGISTTSVRPTTSSPIASTSAAVVRDDDDVDDPQPLPMDSDDESTVVVDPREIEPTASTSR